jgi:hypothetical protein
MAAMGGNQHFDSSTPNGREAPKADDRVRPVVIGICLISVATCLALLATAGGSICIVLPLLIFVQITSFADVGRFRHASANFELRYLDPAHLPGPQCCPVRPTTRWCTVRV